MASPTRFLKLQDMLLAKTSLEKVKMHLEERGERTVYVWVSRELSEFLKRFSRDQRLSQHIDQIKRAIQMEDHLVLLAEVRDSLKIIDGMLENEYRDMAGQ